MNMKDAKTVLFASLIVAIMLPLRGMDLVKGNQDGLDQKDLDDRFAVISEIYSNEKLDSLKEIISKSGITKEFNAVSNGLIVEDEFNVEQLSDNKYKIVSTVKVLEENNEKAKTSVTYFVTENEDGSLHVHVPDARPSEQSTLENHNGLEFVVRAEQPAMFPTADATSGTKKFTMEVERTINNNFVDGSDSFTQNCGMLPSTGASMYAAADASAIGYYWRSMNANMLNALIYMDWCIWRNVYAGTEFEMGGSSYNDKRWMGFIPSPGWGSTGGLQFPWDDLHFRTNVYYYDI